MSNQSLDPNRTPIGDIKARDVAVETFLSKGESQVQEISVNYADSDGNIKQDKIGKDGKVTQDGKVTRRSAKSIYKQAQRIKANAVRSDKWLAINPDSYDRIFGKSNKICQKGKYIINSQGKLELI